MPAKLVDFCEDADVDDDFTLDGPLENVPLLGIAAPPSDTPLPEKAEKLDDWVFGC